MLAAAVLVMVGGEGLSRRANEVRTAADRGRLFDFSDLFRNEIERLDSLYHKHLEELAGVAISESEKDKVIASASELCGVRQIRVFRQKGGDLSFPVGFPGKTPEIEIEGGKSPFNPDTSLVIRTSLLSGGLPASGKWLPVPDPSFSAYCKQIGSGEVVAILVDMREVRSKTTQALADWLEVPLTPLLEAGERVSIGMVGGKILAEVGPEKHGPASAVIPLRTDIAEWQIMAWDSISVSASHDPAILSVATTVALILLSAGILLFIQQNRALRLASDRVSFVNRVSHELGSPLTNLSLNLDLATESLFSRPEESARRLGLVHEEIARLSRLVANVLTFSQHDRKTHQLKPTLCVPSEVIRDVVGNFRPALERRGIAIDVEDSSCGKAVTMDPDALGQIVGNLFSNVEKYANSGKWIGVSCRLEDQRLEVIVRDRGPGIPAAHRERIFAAFTRVSHSTNEGSSGTGLGLSIARDLAREMGGTLALIDESDATGSAFRLDIPAPTAPETP